MKIRIGLYFVILLFIAMSIVTWKDKGFDVLMYCLAFFVWGFMFGREGGK